MTAITPILNYRDARAAMTFLVDAFGFETRTLVDNDDGSIQHAELTYGDSVVMLATAADPTPERPSVPAGSHMLYVAVDDADAHHARAAAAGADVFERPTDRDYGSREYGARDPEGGTWYFGTYVPAAESSSSSA
jgi:uncharacterized glyoxalase superfamily protein PhnB